MARKDAKINALRRDLDPMRMQLETKDKEHGRSKTLSSNPNATTGTRRNSRSADRSLRDRIQPTSTSSGLSSTTPRYRRSGNSSGNSIHRSHRYPAGSRGQSFLPVRPHLRDREPLPDLLFTFNARANTSSLTSIPHRLSNCSKSAMVS